MKKIRKILLYTILLLFLVLIIYPPLSYKKLVNHNPLPEQIKKGVYHIHSVFSDGKGDIREITKAASDLDLDFIILTDHGEPNLKCAGSTSYLNDVLLIGGSEFSLDCGHLASAGFKIEKYQIPREPQEAINDVNKYGGFTFVAHPFDNKIPWTDWDINNFTGLEILSSYSCARKIGIPRLLLFPLRYLLNKDYSLLNTLYYPEKNISVWDSFNKNGKYMGIYALDAHAKLPIMKNFSLNFPSYESMFRILNIYVITKKNFSDSPINSANTIISAIKRGNFFSVIEGISSANGFRMVFESSRGQQYEMGESISNSNGLFIIDLPFPFPVRVKLFRDGKLFFTKTAEPSSKIRIKNISTGVFRAEIFVNKGKFKKLPWIITNPFFLAVERNVDPIVLNKSSIKYILNKKGSFTIEKNGSSLGTLSNIPLGKGENGVKLTYTLNKDEDKIDFWVSLAARKIPDVFGYKGISFVAKSSEPMRFWIEIRTKKVKNEKWYRHSFLSTDKWQIFSIPFNKFHLISGNMGNNNTLDISNVRSLFFSINGRIVNFPFTSGTIEIKKIAVYK